MQDWKDSDLKTLFSEGRERDRESATSFQADWELARSKMAASRRASFKYAIAIGSVAVIALSAAIVLRVLRTPSRQPSAGSQDPSAGIHDLVGHPSSTPSAPPDLRSVPQPKAPDIISRVPGIERARDNRRERRRHLDTEVHQDHQLISAWRSPTDFLLESPGHDLLRTLPNIRDSLVRIDGR